MSSETRTVQDICGQLRSRIEALQRRMPDRKWCRDIQVAASLEALKRLKNHPVSIIKLERSKNRQHDEGQIRQYQACINDSKIVATVTLLVLRDLVGTFVETIPIDVTFRPSAIDPFGNWSNWTPNGFELHIQRGIEINAGRDETLCHLDAIADGFMGPLNGQGGSNAGRKGVSLLDAARLINDDDAILGAEAKKRWHGSRNPLLPSPIGKDMQHSQRDLFDPNLLLRFIVEIELPTVADKYRMGWENILRDVAQTV